MTRIREEEEEVMFATFFISKITENLPQLSLRKFDCGLAMARKKCLLIVGTVHYNFNKT